MAAFVRAFLFCNGCNEPFETDTVPSAPAITVARREARRRGWIHKRDGRDLCPYCKPTKKA